MTAPTSPFYDTSQIAVADSALYIAPAYTPLPSDAAVLWDPTLWTGKTLTAAGATAITLSVTNSLGTQSTASIASFATVTAATLQTTLAALTNVGAGKVTVTGPNGGPFVIVFASSLGATTLAISASTGGTPTVTGGLWLPPGATDAGWQYSATRQVQDITIEEQSTPVNRFITSTSAQISGNASQASSQNLQYAMNAVKSLIAQASQVTGMTILTMTDDLQHYAACLETKNPAGFARRYYIPDTVVSDGFTQNFRRNAQQQMVPLAFTAVCPPSSIVIRDVTAAALP